MPRQRIKRRRSRLLRRNCLCALDLGLGLAGRGQRAHRTMTPVVFLISIMLILGASDVYSFVLEPALDWLSGLFGAKPDTAMDSIDASMGTLAMSLVLMFVK